MKIVSKAMIRKIIHIDMDAFYAAVEQRDNPALRGVPLIIGGNPGKRSVVSTASYEARKYGIHSAMPVSQAVKLCPQVKIVTPDFTKYKTISGILYSFYREYTDAVEPIALDECYLDVTTNKQNIGSATIIAKNLLKRIKEELRLTASAGVSVNKLIAKIASDFNKPDGITVVTPDQVTDFIDKLPISKIPGVGKRCMEKMNELNIKNCHDLKRFTLFELSGYFGIFGQSLYNYVRGIDEREVISDRKIKSIGSEHTLQQDIISHEKILSELTLELERSWERLKKNNKKGRTITIKIKYANFTNQSKSKSENYYHDDYNQFYKSMIELFNDMDIKELPVRLVGISLSNFEEDYGQLELEF